MFLTFYAPTGDTMNSLNDHEPLLWAMRAGLTRDEVRPGRCAVAGHIPWQRADKTKAQRQERLNLDMELTPIMEGVGFVTAGAS